MNAKEIKVGTELEFEILIDSFKEKCYSGKFVEIASGSQVVISTGLDKFELSELPLRTKITVYFNHIDFGPQSFKGTIIYTEEKNKPTLLHLKIEGEIFEVQRREFYRPDCFLKAEYRVVDLNDTSNNNERMYINTQTKNISYNGACILVDNNVFKDSLIDLIVWITDKISIKMLCKVIRISEYKIGGKNNYELGMSIEKITDHDQDILVKFITRSTVVHSLYLGESEFKID